MMDRFDPTKASDPVGSRLRQLGAPARIALGGLLIAVGISYTALLLTAYFQLAPPSSPFPDWRELDQALFAAKKPRSQIERLLETPSGEMNRGGTMRPAFTEQSVGWESLIEKMTSDEKAALAVEREGERLALLDWVCSGASREAYEKDDYAVGDAEAVRQITADYLIGDKPTQSEMASKRVRIRTLLADRCVTCHGENGRHETARFIALDSYERLAPHLRPETTTGNGRVWLIAALMGLYPLAAISGPLFYLTSHPPGAKRLLLTTTLVALAIVSACWFAGKPNSNMIYLLLAAFAVAALIIIVQIFASLGELLTIKRA